MSTDTSTLSFAGPEVEQAVLAALLYDERAFDRVAGWLYPEHFQIERNRLIYEAIGDLRDRGEVADFVTLPDELERRGDLKRVGGSAYVVSLLSALETTLHAEHVEEYARRLVDRSIAQKTFAALQRGVRALHADSADPAAVLRAVQKALEEIEQTHVTASAAGGRKRFSTMADLDGLLGDIRWDWHGWIAPGFAHLLVAEPGVGKSMLALRLAGCYLAGWPWPDGTPFGGERGAVIWAETEAAHAPNRERARRWGLPTERILYPVANPLDSVSLQNPAHLEALRALAKHSDVRLIVVDSFSGGNSKDENDAESGHVVKMLAELARDTGLPVLVTHHLNKAWRSNRITLANIRGSTAIAQYVRLIWALDKPDPEGQPTALRLYAIKSNLAELPPEIGLSISADGIATLGEAPQPPRGSTLLDQAVAFLLEVLAREPLPAKEVEELAEAANISSATLRRAANKLAIVKLRHKHGFWLWSLPASNKCGERPRSSHYPAC